MVKDELADRNRTLFRRVDTTIGCSSELHKVDIDFTNEVGGEWEGIAGAHGCERVRLMIRRSPGHSFELTEVRIKTDGCKAGEWQVCFFVCRADASNRQRRPLWLPIARIL